MQILSGESKLYDGNRAKTNRIDMCLTQCFEIIYNLYINSAYLCEGKRVLVTSKNANALSVLRGRLPQSIRELVVDVSMSESQGEKKREFNIEEHLMKRL